MASEYCGLLVDWGGVLTSDLFESFHGMRRPAPVIYELGAQRIGLSTGDCVFVDDLPFNLAPAAELGMATIHHTEAEQTVAQLESLLGLQLR
jgi:putative hydrolase of the HAD superfamily